MASKSDTAVQTVLSEADMVSKTDSSAQTVISSMNLIPKTKPRIFFDRGYLKTVQAFLKIAQVILCLTTLVCVRTIYDAIYHSSGGWYYFVSMTGLWTSLFFLISYTFHIVERFDFLPWLVVEWGFALLWSICFLIAACVSTTRARQDPAWIALAVLGFIAGCIYGYEAYEKYDKWQKGEVPQEERQEYLVDLSATPNESLN